MPLSVLLIHSIGYCLEKLYIMAFTSNGPHAHSDTSHSVEILARGTTRRKLLYDRSGDDYQLNKGDLWKYNFYDFRFPFACPMIGDIQKVSIVESGNDGWNIDSIVTLVQIRGESDFRMLTQDLDVNRWIDGNRHPSHRRFDLHKIV